ncbi:MAG: prolipoprotein diacylglyceryl transferase [Oscillospiraceae bacterium]
METIMRGAAISFPMLGGLSINPPACFYLFGRPIYWYGVIIAFGFILALLYCASRAPRFGLTQDNVYDLVLWLLPIGIIGARLYFVAFEWQDYKNNLADIFKIWEGGLAIYGGIIAGGLAAVLWCKKKRIPIGATLDICSFGLLIGQSVGRWGNFMNREAFGAETEVFCRMGLTMPGRETVYVHPTFLYESLWNLVGFLLLALWVKKGRRKYDGQVFFLYVLWYGVGRALIEGLRTDSLYLGGTGLRVSQLLAALSALVAAAALLIAHRRQHPALFSARPAESEQAPSDGDENI